MVTKKSITCVRTDKIKHILRPSTRNNKAHIDIHGIKQNELMGNRRMPGCA